MTEEQKGIFCFYTFKLSNPFLPNCQILFSQAPISVLPWEAMDPGPLGPLPKNAYGLSGLGPPYQIEDSDIIVLIVQQISRRWLV